MVNLEKEHTLIEKIALENGFKLKQQPNGKMALNPYVFDFAEKLLDKKQAEITELKQKLKKIESGEFVLVPRNPSNECLKGISGNIDNAKHIYKAMIEAVEKENE